MFNKNSSASTTAIKSMLGLGVVLILGASYTQINKTEPAHTGIDNPKVEKLKLQPGFKAEHLYSPSENQQGSWVSMAFDDKGRMIVSDQYGALYRLKVPAMGSGSTKPEVEKLKIGNATDTLGMGTAQGLLYAFNSLYVVVNNRVTETLPRTSGLYRLQDTDGDDQFDKVTMLKELVGNGEHGPHSIILSPDKKSLYVIAGNHTDIPPMDWYRLPKNWSEDNLFPLIKDPRGHANDRMAPGGWIANVDPEGKRWELISAGYRNAFDMAFDANGDLFVYDADMEWDFGMPWYRPTRIVHATSASEFGWRTGNSKWSAAYPDNLPPVLNIGQGSPTNLLHTRDAKFPAKYKNALLAFDWSFGIVHTILLKPSGSTFTADHEEFLSGIPLPLTDGVIGPDGALYFLTGGRRLESDLYRVYYDGKEPLNSTVAAPPINQANELRRSLEKFHTGGPNKDAIATAWPHLNNPDRFIRYAARLAVEHQPLAEWQAKALAEKDPVRLTNAMIALSRQGSPEQKGAMLKALTSINYAALSEQQQIELLRAFELTFARMGQPDAATKSQVIAYLNPKYPAKSNELNRLFAKVLVFVEAPGVIPKTLALLEAKEQPGAATAGGETATSSAELIMRNPQYGLDIAGMLEKMPPAQQTYLATALSKAKTGWTPELHDRYFKWFRKAFSYQGGRSYIGFIDKARKMALQNVSESRMAHYDKLSGGDLLTQNGNDLAKAVYPKGPGRRWALDEAVTAVDGKLTNRNFAQGKAMYNAITCSRCHAIGGEGGNIGPELSQLATRFSTKDVLEAIIDPHKAVSDQYAATQLTLKNGESIVGRVTNEDKVNYFVSQNPFAPDMLLKVPKKDVVSSKYSAVSIMLPGLINSLNEEELKDLMAYLMAGGNEKHPSFSASAAKSTGGK
ncbi:c-type cytochrome [Telluribacter humicola]|uniref:c-type cytochrome n=1 Tax=Telluribacter humicola TaxID=1720261 RepID=UPI001E3666F0|nr:c-type cytochrome [Telluribacter humicola]